MTVWGKTYLTRGACRCPTPPSGYRNRRPKMHLVPLRARWNFCSPPRMCARHGPGLACPGGWMTFGSGDSVPDQVLDGDVMESPSASPEPEQAQALHQPQIKLSLKL